MNSENIRISVIVPVYNVEKYLHQCVSSVLEQTYKNIELILVDDGSTDKSPDICDEYARCDKRVKVIHKTNGGLSSARNAGIKIATGKYLMFLDSDDFWNDNKVLSGMFGSDSDKDVICFGYKEYFDNGYIDGRGTDDSSLFQCSESDVELLKNLIATGVITSSACTKAVKTKLITENEVFFIEGITSEDIDWTARVILSAKSYAVFPCSFYAYRQRNDSIVHTIKYENLEMLAGNVERCVKYAQPIDNKELLDVYYNYVAYQYISFLMVSLLCENDNRTKLLLKYMKKYRWILNYHMNKKVKMVYWFNKIIGYRLMHQALKLYSKVR